MKRKYLAIITVLSFAMVSCGGDSNKVTDAVNDVTEDVVETVEETVEDVIEEVEEVVASNFSAGETVYTTTCVACHQATGEGITGAFPPLANSDYLLEDKMRAIKQIINGSSEEMVVNGETYIGTMTPQNLEDQQIVDVMNYILNSWGNEGGEVTLADVESQK